MKKILLLILVVVISTIVQAQQQTFDIVTYTPPKGWKQEIKDNLVSYTTIDKKKKTWCQIGVYKSTPSNGDRNKDFENEWTTLAVQPFNITDTPSISELVETEGWTIRSTSAAFKNNSEDAITIVTTMIGYGVVISIVANTNNHSYLQKVYDFVETIDLAKPQQNALTDAAPANNTNQPASESGTSPAKTDNFTFNTTNFDDGWTSKVQADWVEVTKGNLKVLLHYANEKIKPANTDVNVMCEAAWNVLVAPKYSSIENYQITPSVLDHQRPYYAEAYVTDKISGNKVFVALVRKGNTPWMEFITPDKNTFLQAFALDISKITYYSETNIWDPLIKMNGYNKFAIAVTDFRGKWSDRFSSNTYYANIYTGMSAGMSTYSSSEYFEFSAGQHYKWQLIAANTAFGATSVANAKGAGTFKVLNNWQIYFSDLEGKPKTYDAYFTAVKDGRILWMNDAKYPGSGIFTGYGQAK
jgi:hypothetical protein